MHPSYFNPSLSAYLKLSLRRQVEGSCSGRLGYIIAVTQDNLDQPEGADEDEGMRGRIKEDGQAVFRLRYQAIVYRPFRGEVVDGLVASVNKVRSYCFFILRDGSRLERKKTDLFDIGRTSRRWESL